MPIDRSKFERRAKYGIPSILVGPISLIVGPGLIVVFVAIYVGIFKLASFLWKWLLLTFQTKWAALLVCLAFLVVGYGLFTIRKKWRFAYGLMEISFALASGWRWFSSVNARNSVDMFAALAVVYLIVRGMDNCHQAREAGKKAIANSIENARNAESDLLPT